MYVCVRCILPCPRTLCVASNAIFSYITYVTSRYGYNTSGCPPAAWRPAMAWQGKGQRKGKGAGKGKGGGKGMPQQSSHYSHWHTPQQHTQTRQQGWSCTTCDYYNFADNRFNDQLRYPGTNGASVQEQGVEPG